MEYTLNQGAAGGVRLGLIVLQTDETLEFEAWQVLAGRDAALFHTRIPNAHDVTPETLAAMANEMPKTAALLPEGLDAVGYGCTSGATVIGSDAVAGLVARAHPKAAVTDPIRAVVAALHALGAVKIAMVTPYVPSVTAPMRALLGRSGIDVVSEISFSEGNDWRVARIDPASTRAAMLGAAEAGQAAGAEAIFASCTNLQTFSIIDGVEAETGLPVVSSNQALLWHLLKVSGARAQGWGPGRLFTL
ncbi:Asp/Glu racemase [Roseovarius sp. LXJ103]|uniref:maleate cis-trans isomerase family protein n=1 Tax=Roseovarius carneus TaxID=2853164 RepID=UPI000D61C2EA|nr:aspartate/glutamate racemase family protein [Roseovarius carneus]MBZ8119090.1 Asp/Glu racemase [Roseovarius carneus]PWE35271.1 Asp/Glu racemase [Pelagicola sp. LXJ1103]